MKQSNAYFESSKFKFSIILVLNQAFHISKVPPMPTLESHDGVKEERLFKMLTQNKLSTIFLVFLT